MIRHYRHLDLPSAGYPAALACLQVERPPGTSDEMRAAARRLARTAQAVRDTMARLRAVADATSEWEGDGADAFREAIQEPTRAHIDRVPERYDGYAKQLTTYATALDGLRSRLDAARARVRSAVEAHHVAALATPVPQLPRWSGETPAIYATPTPAVEAGEQECALAARQFQLAHNDWVDAANRCIDGLKNIDKHDGLHNPHGWRAAGNAIAGFDSGMLDELSGLMDSISGLSTVLALVALPLCPELSFVLFAIATQASAVKLAADSERALSGEDVGWRTFALDAYGAIPLAGPAKGALSAYRAGRAAEGVVGRIGAAGHAFGGPVTEAFTEAYAGEQAQALETLVQSGALAKSVWAVSWEGVGDALGRVSPQDLLGVPISSANQAYDDREQARRRRPG